MISILLAAMFAASLASCGVNAEKQAGASDTSAASAAETTTPVSTTAPYDDGLPEGLDYKGFVFNTLTYSNATWEQYLVPENLDGELLNDNAYNRNLDVKGKLNIELVETKSKTSVADFNKMVLAGDKTYSLLTTFANENLISIVTGNSAMDWQDIPHLNLDAPWYNQSSNEVYVIAGKQFFTVSDYTRCVHQFNDLLFNKKLCDDLGKKYPYQAVYDGDWTYELFLNYMTGVTRDLNGDGALGYGDMFGLTALASAMRNFYYSAGEGTVKRNADGTLSPVLTGDRLISVVERIVKLYNSDDCIREDKASYQSFYDGNAMFTIFMSDPVLLRTKVESFDFGLLPMPKHDEKQDRYYTFASGGIMAVPMTTGDADRAGAIIEALSAASGKYLNDAFIEVYVENKILRDEDSVKTYGIMRDTLMYDFTRSITPHDDFKDSVYIPWFVTNNSTNVNSRAAGLADAINGAFTQMCQTAAKAIG